ncbi:hypothetical protein HanHA300_Chr05g0159421 [Helianthus annuus]|nr:hypothetical protein HanHA300_Chr05g0159421 [Helianthus annuus]KAJ0921112.1 hypothetical protein HanPSC8_Chr05g0187771 [Helianthus annuus]
MDQMHDDKWWLMTSMGEMYKCMGISVPPHPLPRVYLDQGPFFTQQPDPCHFLSSPSRPCRLMARAIFSPTFPCYIFLSPARPHPSFLCPTFPCRLQARPIRGTARHTVLGVARTLRRKSSLSLMRIDNNSGLCYHYMMQYCTNN